jgi:metal-sulfur cluster biosynthetic enzyme
MELDDHPLSLAALHALRQVLDPELGVNVVDLGLVLGLQVQQDRLCLRMTFTSAACPMGEQLLDDIDAVLLPLLPADMGLDIALGFDPPWHPGRMQPAARAALGWPLP